MLPMFKMPKYYFNRYLVAIFIAGATFVFMHSVAFSFARGYITDDAGLQGGMVVSLSVNAGDESRVERATSENSERIVGVVTTFDDSLVTVASKSAGVLVESEGEVEAYVSDVNGSAKKGDLLVLSPFKGILMKASENPSAVVGIAASDLGTAKQQTYSVKDGDNTKNTQIAKIRINLNRQGTSNANPLPPDSSLARLGKAIVGKDVGEIRVVIAMIIFFTVLIAEGGILYGAISSSMTALGRNPLARKVIRREMLRVVIIALVVLMLGLGAIYGILWI